MTTITKDIAAKLAVALVAVAMVFAAFAPAAQAQTTEELQAMINDLLAQVAALSAGDATVATAGVCPYTWTRDLSMGSTGVDVMKLQQFLNADPDTRVAAAGQVGSAGMETEYYGPATAAAVSKMQVKYRAEVLTPGGLVNPTGYFGPSSRAKANSACVAAPVMDDDMDDDDDMMDDDEDDNSSSNQTLSGEASLDNFEIDGAENDEIEEGAEDAPIAELTFEFTDGDAELARIDMQVISDGGNNGDDDPWDVFETFQLWVDGDMVAEEAADDEDDYLDEDAGTFRFSNLDLFAEEDEELEIVVAVTLQNSLEGVSSGDDEVWTVEVNSIRFFDADGVAITEDSGQDFGTTESFTIEAEGADDELSVRTNSNDPDATTLPVEDDSDSDWYTVFVFDLDTEDSDNDIELNGLVLNVLTAENAGLAADAGYDDLVDDVELVIDGVTIDDVTIGGTSATAGTATLDFDIDGDVVIDAGDRVEVELMLKFNSLALADEGATIQASISSLDDTIVDAEGGDDLEDSQLGGSATGEVHTLRTEGLILTITDISSDEDQRDTGSGDLDFGTYVFEFDVTAFEEDFFTDEDADVINYRLIIDGVEQDETTTLASSTATLNISNQTDGATADEKLADGQAAEYVFTVETATDISGSVEVIILSIDYSAADDNTEELNQTANPDDDWTSGSEILN